MRRFYISDKDIVGDNVTISGAEAHHIKDVIRLKREDRFTALDGKGVVYICSIEKVTKDVIVAKILERKRRSLELPKITIATAIAKAHVMDYIIQKASELGVESIIPLITERTVVKLDDKKKLSKINRWRRIATESCKQCGREKLLEVSDPMLYADLFKEKDKYNKHLITSLTEKRVPLKGITFSSNDQRVIILIGPEGDFTIVEIDLAIKNKFIPVSLGPLILRVDTACIYAASILMSKLSPNEKI